MLQKKPSDFRPISLLCTDYKLLAGVLAERLKTTLPTAIGENQRGGVPERKIFNSLTLLRDSIERVNELKERGGKMGAALVAIDLEKAYDFVDRNALWTIMDTMGYPKTFVDKLRTLYEECEMSIMNGGDECGRINCTNSVRQGCPLSMHLFVIYLEPLIAKLETILGGLNVGGKRIKLRAYVDDLTVVATTDREIEVLGECLDKFCFYFGAKISKIKTTIMGIGEWKGRVDWPLDWMATTEELKITGIHFSPTLCQTIKRNWERINGHIIGVLTTHAARDMTIQQRSLFIKSFCLSRAIYVAKVLECPEPISLKILKETQRFLWYGRFERPKRGVSYEDGKEGGLDFRNPRLFFKSLLTKTFLDDLYGEESAEKELLKYWSYWRAKELKLPIGPWTNSAKSDYDPPDHIESLLKTVQQLINDNIVKTAGKACHKTIY